MWSGRPEVRRLGHVVPGGRCRCWSRSWYCRYTPSGRTAGIRADRVGQGHAHLHRRRGNLPAQQCRGWSDISDVAPAKSDATDAKTHGVLLNSNNHLQHATLAIGSAIVCSSTRERRPASWRPSSRNTTRRRSSRCRGAGFISRENGMVDVSRPPGGRGVVALIPFATGVLTLPQERPASRCSCRRKRIRRIDGPMQRIRRTLPRT